MSSKEKQDWHWFTSSVANWSANDSLIKCVNQQRRADGGRFRGFQIWRVPGFPMKDQRYNIDNYAPQVEGAEFVGYEFY